MIKIDLQKIESYIREVAKEEILPRWRNLHADDIQEKTGPTDIVTIADKAAERSLTAKLLQHYPDSFVVGEEAVESNPAIMGHLKSDKPTWIIDPIDGTSAFAAGSPSFDIMLALVQNGEMLAGWIYAPTDDDFYMAERGSGVWRNDKGQTTKADKIPHTLSVKDLTGILGKKSFSEEKHAAIKEKGQHLKKLISTICAGHDYARFLRGEVQLAIYNKCMPWDHVAGLMMASELGFGFSKHDSSAYKPWDVQGGLVVYPDYLKAETLDALML